MKKWIVGAMVAVVSVGVFAAEKPMVEGAEPGKWTMDIEAAKKVAAEKKMPLLLNFTGSDWCGWCKLMDKQVFGEKEWQEYAAGNLLLVWIDFPKDKSLVPEKFVAANEKLSEEYGVRGYPTYIVLDDDGKSVLGQLGADREATPAKFIQGIKGLTINRASAIDALLAKMSGEEATNYRNARKTVESDSAELRRITEVFEKRSAELEDSIHKSEALMGELITKARLAALPEAKANIYKAKQAEIESIQAEMRTWMESGPERNDENMQKYRQWIDKVADIEREMVDLLTGGK